MDSNDSSSALEQGGRSARPGASEGVGTITSQVQANVKLGPGRIGKTARPGSFSQKRMDWTPAKIAALTDLWSNEHLTAKQIGKRLGVSSNAVIGKAHRLGLSRRESIIPPSKKPRPKPTPPPARNPEAPYHLVDLAGDQCRWPVGNPGGPDFGFCGKPVAADRPYCHKHCCRAYVKKPIAAGPQEAV